MSKWVEHIKDFAKRNNMTYRDALKDPKCSEEYRIKFPKSAKKSKKDMKLETESVPLEETKIDTAEPKKKKVVAKKPLMGKGIKLTRDMVMKMVGEGMKC